MRRNFLQRFAVIFCLLLVLLQVHPYMLRSNRLTIKIDDQQYGSADYSEEKANGSITANTNSKRNVALITNIFVGVSMLVGLGFDIYMHIERCCGVSTVCKLRKEFNTVLKDVKAKSAENELNYAKAENKKMYLIYLHAKILELNVRIADLDTLQTNLLKALDTNIVQKIQTMSTSIRVGVEQQNKTISSYKELEDKFKSVFVTAQSTLMRMSGFITPVVEYALTSYVKNAMSNSDTQFANRMRKAPSRHAKAWHWAGKKYNAVTATIKNSRLAKYLTGYGSGMSAKTKKILKGTATVLIGIAYAAQEIWGIVKKVNTCKKMAAEVGSSLTKLREEYPLLAEVKANITLLDINLTNSYKTLKDQLQTNQFLEFTKQFVQMAHGILNQKALHDVKIFQEKIKTADYLLTDTLVQNLADAIAIGSTQLKCYIAQINNLNYIYKECSAGNINNFEFLFGAAQADYKANTQNCVDVPYVNKSGAKDFIFQKLTNNSLKTECILNSINIRKVVCANYVLADMSNTAVAIKNGLTAAQVDHFLTKCQTFDLDPTRQQNLCTKKWDGKTIKELQTIYHKFRPSSVSETYSMCPHKPCDSNMNELACLRKLNGESLVSIINAHPGYEPTCLTTAFNGCQLKDLFAAKNILDLKSLCSVLPGFSVDHLIFKRYIVAYGSAALVSLKADLSRCPDSNKKKSTDNIRSEVIPEVIKDFAKLLTENSSNDFDDLYENEYEEETTITHKTDGYWDWY